MRTLLVLALMAVPLAVSGQLYTCYDSLWIADNQTYDAANGDAWAGRGVFGQVYDLMVADDLPGSKDGGWIWYATGAYVTFFGNNPAEGAYVALYQDTGAGPSNKPMYEGVFPTTATPFTDTVFGLLGLKVTADLSRENWPCLDYAHWITIQPKDTTPSGDWYYIVRDLDSRIGNDAYMRDGGRAAGGYGTTVWVSAGTLGFGAGDSAIKVECWIPEPATLSLLGLAALPFLRLRK